MMKSIISILFLAGIILFTASFGEETKTIEEGQSVNELLLDLGDAELPHQLDPAVKGVSSKRGEEIIKYGFTNNAKGNKVKKQSKHFVCTSCHNVVKDEPDLSVSDPEERLRYSIENDLPFLQGSSMYGAVNRTSFYNDDYYKKYGDLVYLARNNIREAIQLCATECAQGRALEDWEIESILSYLYDIDLKVEDLSFNAIEKDFIESALNDSDVNSKKEAIELVKSKYLAGSPATFVDPPVKRKNLTFENPDLQMGKMIYEKSCLYCHENGKYSYLTLDNSNLTFAHLSKKANGFKRHSIYQVIRYGVPSYVMKKSYMPNYTAERMSDSQLDNLRAYIDYMAKRG